MQAGSTCLAELLGIMNRIFKPFPVSNRADRTDNKKHRYL